MGVTIIMQDAAVDSFARMETDRGLILIIFLPKIVYIHFQFRFQNLS
jgi:hypothetical protein